MWAIMVILLSATGSCGCIKASSLKTVTVYNSTIAKTTENLNEWIKNNPNVKIINLDYEVVRVEGQSTEYSIFITYK